MGNICCRKATYSPPVTYFSPKMKKAPPPPCVAGEKTNGTIPNLSTHEVMAHHPGDDCAINELLEGNMDLEVVLPDSKIVRMTVERRIPMMDLLVQVTKANKISPGGHFISLSASNKDSLHYKPNTPIGSLDTNTIYIMSKSAMNDQPATKMLRSQSQPFEKTFRLQVNLPKKQLMVIRVSPKTTLAEIKKMICTEKKLEYSQYYLVHPSQPSCVVDLNYSLSEYACTEISIINKTSMNSSISNSTSDLIGYPLSISEDEKKKKKLLNIFKRKSKSVNNMMLAGEAFKDTASSRGVSPARSDICDTHSLRAKRQSTKKRAPPPPPPPPPLLTEPQHQTPQTTEREVAIKNNCSSELSQTMSNTVGSTTIITTMVSHSRQSSDSSGYHEASVLSDSPDNLSPETSGGSGSSGIHSTDNTEQETQKTVISKCNSRLKTRDKPNFNSVAHSMLILSTNKKRKAPPPPPLSSQSSLNKENIKSENEANTLYLERETSTSNCEKNSDLSSKTVPEVKPVMIEIVNDALIQESTVPENVTPLIKNNIDSCKSPSENGIQCSSVEQSDLSPISSPVSSSPSQVNSSTEPETLDTNNQKLEIPDTNNHCHTEEETGEVIHFLEKDQLSEEKSEQEKNIKSLHSMNTFESNLSTEVIKTEENNSDELIIDPITKDEDADKEISLNPVEKPVEEQSSEISDPEWDFNIPEPPSPFRNNIDYSKTFEPELTIQMEKDEIQPVVANYNNSLEVDELKETSDRINSKDLDSFQDVPIELNVINNSPPSLPETLPPRDHCYSVGSTSSDIPPPLPVSDPPESSRDKSDSFCSTSSVVSFPEFDPSVKEFNEFNPVYNEFNNKSKNEMNDRNKIENEKFISISKINITDQDSKIDFANNLDSKASITNNQVSSQTYITVPQPKRRPHLENFTIGSYTNGKLNTDLTDASQSFISSAEIDKTSKSLIGTNSSVNEDSKESNKVIKPNYNFTIIPFKCRNNNKEDNEIELNHHKESSELLYQKETIKIEEEIEKVQSIKSTEKTENTKLEQHQLEEEYQKLQNQLLAWQQQLVKNQTLLQEKQIVPEMSVPDLSPLCSQSKVEEKSNNIYRSQTLPRLKPNLNKDPEQIHYSTVEYHSQPKSHILKNVTIGSWEREPEITSGLVAEVKPKFQNMNMSQVNNHNVLEKTKISNTLLEDNEKPKLARISAKFDIKPSSNNNKNIEANRTSESLEDAPPAVILAQIRKEMKANAKYPAGSVLNTESQKENSVSKTYIRPKSQVTYSYYSSASDDRISHLTKLSTQNPIKVNENMNKPIVVATIKSKPTLKNDIVNGDSNVSLPLSSSVSIPPPLPPIVPINTNNSKFSSTTNKLKVSRTEPQSDPREELMIEIRNFGGRRALRKVPLNQAGWHLKVFGTLSSSSV